MFYHAASNQYINQGMAFEIDGTQYPQNWLNLSSPEEKAAAGLSEVTVSGQREDDRFYWVSESLENGVRTYTNNPKDLDGLKAQWKGQINQIAYSMLLPTDWIDLRNLRDPNFKVDWMLWRESVRTTAANAVAAIEAAADVPALQAAVKVTWPTDPSYVSTTQGETL